MNAPRITDVSVSDLVARCKALVDAGGRMQMAYAWRPGSEQAIELRYVTYPQQGEPFEVWRCCPGNGSVPSLAPTAPLLSWYEREISDLFGLSFEGHPDPEPLTLLPGASTARPPMTTDTDEELRYEAIPYRLPELTGAHAQDIQRLPFGPIRADVLESGQFVFFYIGESILYYHPQLFFKHRGMEKRFEGLGSDLGAVLAERVSGVGSVAHALAYSQAVEAAAGCRVPPRGAGLRVILAELERLYNHLHYLGHLSHTTTLKVGEAQGKYLEELAKQLNAKVTGSRLLRGLIAPGGLRRDLKVDGLREQLDGLEATFQTYAQMLEASTTHLDRLITTGALSKQLGFDQGATGPVERASGLDRDLRRDQPYANYARLGARVASKQAGDAHARQQVRLEEIVNSFAFIRHQIEVLEAGPVHAACCAEPDSEGLGWAESPRGALFYAVHIGSDGTLARVKIKSPSFSNWRAFAFTVHESNMMDYAINEASFGLTIAGCDR